MAQGPLLSSDVTNHLQTCAALGVLQLQQRLPKPPGLCTVYHSGFNLPYLCSCKNLVLPVLAECRINSRREELTGAGRAWKGPGSVEQEQLSKQLLCGTAQARMENTDQTPTVPT